MTPRATDTANAPRGANPFTPRQILLWTLGFALAVYAANRAVYALHQFAPPFDGPRFWPFSVFQRRLPTPLEAVVAVLVWIAGLLIIRTAAQSGYRWGTARVAVFAFALVVGTNAIQGLENGFYTPIAGVSGPLPVKQSILRRDLDDNGRGIQYWHDAGDVESADTFLRTFNAIQPTLRDHSRTHPPGAVLLFHGLRRATGDRPALASLLVAAFSVALGAWGMRRLASAMMTPDAETDHAPKPLPDTFPVLLFLLLPAVQIYFCSTLDAVICALLLATLAAFAQACREDNRAAPVAERDDAAGRPRPFNAAAGYTLLAGTTLAAALFLTFGALWTAGPLLALALFATPRPARALARLAVVGVLALLPLALLRAGWGMDYVMALRTASHLENPNGFRLIAEPISYLVTRLENVAEIAVFFGPFLLALAWRGLPALRRPSNRAALALVCVGIGTLPLLFLSGAYRTGETARACLFLYPLLLLPVASATTTPAAKRQTLALVWTQTVLMQTFGWYFW